MRKRTGVKRKGPVFADRYHVEVIRSPRQARHALAYVLNNWRKHREDRHVALVDRFSTGVLFAGWKERAGVGPFAIPSDYEPLVVRDAKTWLLRVGWERHGLISLHERPGPRPVPRRAA